MMDQEVFENSITKMKHRIEEGDLKKAIYIADKIDWAEVKDVNLLLYVSMIYEDYKDYDSAKALIEYAYEVAPIKSKLYFALCNINIKLGDMKRAKDYYLSFCEVFPNDNKKILLKYYFLKKKGADATQKCRVLEEYIEEEKTEDTLFELAIIYEEMGEKEKIIKTCEYIVEFFGVKKTGYGRKALELKKKYTPLSSKEEDLLINYVKENGEEEHTNIVYQNIKRPNLKVVKENEDSDIKIEKINREIEKKEDMLEENDEEIRPVIKYEPETMEGLRDKELSMAFMRREIKKKREDTTKSSAFNVYREKSFKRKDKNMKVEDLKQNMIIEAYSRQEAFDIATEELYYLHKAKGDEKKAAKASAYNINERGFGYYLEKLGDRDLIIESAGQLQNQKIDEIEEYILRNNKKNIIVLCDIINNFDKIAVSRPSFIDRFDVYSILSEKKQEMIDEDSDIKKNFGDVVNAPSPNVGDALYASRAENTPSPNAGDALYASRATNAQNPKIVNVQTPNVANTQNQNIVNTQNPNVGDALYASHVENTPSPNVGDALYASHVENTPSPNVGDALYASRAEIVKNVKENIAKKRSQDMDVDEFVEFCKEYAKSIDCNMPGKTIPALYERIEMMAEEGLALTEKRAIELIEQAADKAEKPRLFSKPKYDKEGNLILQEEHFIE